MSENKLLAQHKILDSVLKHLYKDCKRATVSEIQIKITLP